MLVMVYVGVSYKFDYCGFDMLFWQYLVEML